MLFPICRLLRIGAAGLRRFRHDPTTFVIFLGIFLTGFGSSYYHWDPNDDTLFWDRLPMTLCFMAILAASIEERISKIGSCSALAASRNRPVQSLAMALDRRSAALLLGAILSLPGVAAAAFAVPAQIYRHVLLGYRRGTLRAGQVVRVLRSRRLFADSF